MKIEKLKSLQAFALIGMLTILALLLRLPGYDGRALWVDELWRVHLVLNKNVIAEYWPTPQLSAALTSPLYLLFNRAIAYLWGISPEILRISSLLPGLASVVIAFLIVRKAGAGLLLACVGGLFFALNADFIQYSNEFKPYMFEVFVHLCCFYAWLNIAASDTPERRNWLVFFGVVAIALFCTPNIVFLLPAFGLSLLNQVWTKERQHRRLLIIGFGCIALMVGVLYIFLWSYASDKDLINYWSGSFYRSSSESYFSFAINRLYGLWKGSFTQVGEGRLVPRLLPFIWLLVLVYGALKARFMLRGVARNIAIFYLSFVITLLGINYAGFWPLGQIRPNQFVYAHLAIMFVLVLRWCASPFVQKILAGILLVVMLHNAWRADHNTLVGQGPPLEQSDEVWAALSQSGEVGQMIEAQCKKSKVKVFMDPAMSSAAAYFLKYDAWRKLNKSALEMNCVELISVPDAYIAAEALKQKILASGPLNETAWFAYSHLNNAEVNALRSVATEFGEISRDTKFVGAGYFLVTRVDSAKR